MKNTYLLALLLVFSFSSHAALSPQVDSILMSDGRKLAADVYIPAGMISGPVILVQTPYNRQLYRLGLPLNIGLNVNTSNYIMVVVDWRGFYGSAAAGYVGAPSMGADGYNCVEWIAQQSWSNGKIGTWGPSALGKVQFQTAEKQPPHLVCMCPLVAGPQYEYVEYYPNGVLRTEYLEQLSTLGFGLQTQVMAHQLHDNTWTYAENTNFYPDSITVPCYMIGGWYDHTIPQMLPFFNAIQNSSPVNVRSKHRLLMGPWVHGGHGIAQVGSSLQGQLSYPNANNWDDSLALVFFDYHLRNIANGWDQSPVVQYYQMGDDTWNNAGSWPPTGPVSTNFYLHTDGTMDNTAPTASADSLKYNYDPTDPSPTIGGPTLRNDLEQGPYDQVAQVESRNDLLMFTTAPLTQNVIMKGHATIHLKVSSNRPDTDFDLRLTDVYPDGRSMLVKDGALRMRFLNGNTASDTAPIVAGRIYDCNISTSDAGITFLAGHKIRVDITSSNYPRFNRNMNNDGVQYPGKSLDSVLNPLVASNAVYLNSTNASYLELPLVNYAIPTAIAETSEAPFAVSVFPNPSSNQTIVSVSENTNGSIYLMDALGRQVSVQPITGLNNVIPLHQLSSGMYFIKVETGKASVSKKLIIE